MSQINVAQSSQGAGAVVFYENEILLVQVNYGKAIGRWILPGGMVETGEHPFQTAIRETKEETNLTIEIDGLVSIRHRIDEKQMHNTYWVFKGRLVDPSTKDHIHWPHEELQCARWWSIKEALKDDQVQPLTQLFLQQALKGVILPALEIPIRHKFANDTAY